MSDLQRMAVFEQIENRPVEAYAQRLGKMALQLALIPPHMQPGVARYVLFGIKPGSFLTLLLQGQQEAWRRADDMNVAAKESWLEFLAYGLPGECHGSAGAMESWVKAGGWVKIQSAGLLP